MELATLILSLTALAYKSGQFIVDLKNSGSEFENTMSQVTLTTTTLAQLKDLFTSSSFPAPLASEYTCQIQNYQSALDNIETRFKSIQRRLRSKSPFKRYFQKKALVDTELQQLTNRLLMFNSNLNLMMTAYSSKVLGLIYDGSNTAELGVFHAEHRVRRAQPKTPTSREMMGMGIELGCSKTAALATIQLDDAFVNRSSWGGNTTTAATSSSGYDGIKLSTSIGVCTMVWDFD